MMPLLPPNWMVLPPLLPPLLIFLLLIAAATLVAAAIAAAGRRLLGWWLAAVEEIHGQRWASSAKASRCKLIQLADPRLSNLGFRVSTKDAQCCPVVGELLATPQRDGARHHIRLGRRTLRQQRWVCFLHLLDHSKRFLQFQRRRSARC